MSLVQVTVCKEGNDCPETVTLARDDSRLLTEFSSSVPLELCTDYSLHIKPVCLLISICLCIYISTMRSIYLPRCGRQRICTTRW